MFDGEWLRLVRERTLSCDLDVPVASANEPELRPIEREASGRQATGAQRIPDVQGNAAAACRCKDALAIRRAHGHSDERKLGAVPPQPRVELVELDRKLRLLAHPVLQLHAILGNAR